ncbi:MAG TPA: monofunctional biosynthetic peptidoglycan transglycosylase [Myxococcota bacterium]
MSRRSSLKRRVATLAAQVALGILIATAVPVIVLRWVPPLTSSIMLQREIRARVTGERGFVLRHHWVPLRQISPDLAIAVVAAEDQKFPLHSGFDWGSIGDVISEGDERPRGASTLTQQVAKNLFLWPGRSLVRKGLEAWFTVLLETLWPKRRILEVYLNVAEFGPGVYGAGAASERFFGKPAASLDRREAALLAAVLPSPRRLRAADPSAYVERRAAWIERSVARLGGRSYLARL